jgi:hypothetical protein
MAVKLLQEAARKGQQQKESDKKLEDEAIKAAAAENAKRAKNGQSLGQNGAGQGGSAANISGKRDAQGNPLYGSKITIPTIDRRPAANRVSGLPNFILAPPFDPVGTSHFGRSKGTGSLTRNEWFLAFLESQGNFLTPGGGPPTLFTVSPGGPHGLNYLRFAPANITIYTAFAGIGASFLPRTQTAVDEPGVSSNEVGTSLTRNNTRENVFAFRPSPLSPYTLYDLNKLKGYTFEFYVKRPTVTQSDFTIIPDPNFVLTSTFVETSRVFAFLEAAGPGDFFPPIRDLIEVSHTIRGFRTYLQPGVTTWSTSMAIGYLNRNTSYFSWTNATGDSTYTFDEWQHFAVCIDADTASLYIGGQLASTRSHAFADIMQEYADAAQEAGDTDGRLTLRARTSARISTTGGETGVQGIRFTPRVLYTESFTPPVIQTFA